MDPIEQAASRIIKEQQAIIGPVALDQAKKVAGLSISGSEVKVTGNKKETLEKLVRQFEKLFGKASVQVCKEAFSNFADKIPSSEIPDILKN